MTDVMQKLFLVFFIKRYCFKELFAWELSKNAVKCNC